MWEEEWDRMYQNGSMCLQALKEYYDQLVLRTGSSNTCCLLLGNWCAYTTALALSGVLLTKDVFIGIALIL